jgi:hypothetical protein
MVAGNTAGRCFGYTAEQMSLAQTILTHTDIGVLRAWNNIATTCHFASVYWLYMAEFTTELTLLKLGNIGAPQQAMTQLAQQFGVRVNNPIHGSLVVTPGSVLIFMRNGSAGHSCIAVQPGEVAGYNQVGWWTLGGIDHGFSIHQTHQLRWGHDNAHRNKLQKGAEWYELYSAPEMTARGLIRSMAG